MAEIVTDTNGQQITAVNLTVNESSESGVFVIRFKALANYKLTAPANSLITVLARKTGSGATFQNIAANPIDVSPFANTVVDYDLKIAAATVNLPIERVALPVRLTPNI